MTIKTVTNGFFNADIVLRSALIAAFADIRANPWLFDYIFTGLVNDELTRKTYGQKQVDEARQYFMNNEIPVTWSHSPDFSIPRITIVPTGTSEVSQTLGDIHYQPTEAVESSNIVAVPYPTVGPFSPATWDQVTGTLVLPKDLTTNTVFAGMQVIDQHTNKYYPILEVTDDQSLMLDPGTRANLTKCFIAPMSNLYLARLESLEHQETFQIYHYITGNPVYSIYLHSILAFALNKFKQDLLEARGYERTTCTSGPTEMMHGQDNKEIIYSRSITITGFTRNYWPKSVTPLIQGLVLGLNVDSNLTSDGLQEVAQGWGTVEE